MAGVMMEENRDPTAAMTLLVDIRNVHYIAASLKDKYSPKRDQGTNPNRYESGAISDRVSLEGGLGCLEIVLVDVPEVQDIVLPTLDSSESVSEVLLAWVNFQS
uniref:Uncharacterized protein n=1 Tax=Anopheles atroparvus TaxID=41427 RepID=A0A182INW8_ANOAO